jgi:hypothetical protein
MFLLAFLRAAFYGGCVSKMPCSAWIEKSQPPIFRSKGARKNIRTLLQLRYRFRPGLGAKKGTGSEAVVADGNGTSGPMPVPFFVNRLPSLRDGEAVVADGKIKISLRHSAKQRWADPSSGGKDGGSVLWRRSNLRSKTNILTLQ